MLKIKIAGLGIFALMNAGAFAGTMGPINDDAAQNYYIGLGGSYNSITMNNKLYAFGISNTYVNSALTTYGAAGGNSNQLPSVQSTFAPQVQAGVQKYLTGRKDYWGAKVLYQFLNGHAVTYNVPIAQYGSYVDAGTGRLQSSEFAGNVVAESAQVITNHQLDFFALIGHSFKHSDLYFGAGPTLFGMQSKINNAFPFANIDGVSTSQSETPISYSKTMWTWGGGAQLGMTYHFSSSWFLDLNYTYAATASNTVKNPLLPIGKKPITAGGNTTYSNGVLNANSSQAVAVQTLALTVNKKFNF